MHFASRRNFAALVRHRRVLAGARCQRDLDGFLSQLELSFKGMPAETKVLPSVQPGLSLAIAELPGREAGPVPGLVLPSFAFGFAVSDPRVRSATDAALRFLTIAGNEQRKREGKTIRRLRSARHDERRVTISELARVRGGRPIGVEAEIDICLARSDPELWLATQPGHIAAMHEIRKRTQARPWPDDLLDELHVDFAVLARMLPKIETYATRTLLLQQGVAPQLARQALGETERILSRLGRLHVTHSLRGQDLVWELDWRYSEGLGAALQELAR